MGWCLFLTIQWVWNSGMSQLEVSPTAWASLCTHLTSSGAGLSRKMQPPFRYWGPLSSFPGFSATAWFFFHPIASPEYLCSMAAGFPEQKSPDFLRLVELVQSHFLYNLLVKGMHKAGLIYLLMDGASWTRGGKRKWWQPTLATIDGNCSHFSGEEIGSQRD